MEGISGRRRLPDIYDSRIYAGFTTTTTSDRRETRLAKRRPCDAFYRLWRNVTRVGDAMTSRCWLGRPPFQNTRIADADHR